MSNSHAHSPLKAVTLTHVRYHRGDQLGHFLAWISLVPVFISLGGFISHFIFRRELQVTFFALGLLISQFINEIIKTSVQQARPETCALLEMCDSHGWPSSHSQYMFFFAVYCTLLTYYKIGILARKQLWVVGLLVWPLAILTMYSRVYLGYHTVAQVFAGAALGAVLGGGWFWVVNSLLRFYFPAIEESAFGSSQDDPYSLTIVGVISLLCLADFDLRLKKLGKTFDHQTGRCSKIEQGSAIGEGGEQQCVPWLRLESHWEEIWNYLHTGVGRLCSSGPVGE
ncbi:unnamed protein product [Fraxinus pennsylvanica]|uniref:Phosphatidic acid phosphatase type 2/haloperoxidase domain-containing protein n=1 Tax=Fraxinus pennsylvanica TaxID=56036 RepID=A0AAD1ZBQ7_9LAMI|nr:unnamed protein product [Fraxinus pennsylvanica]